MHNKQLSSSAKTVTTTLLLFLAVGRQPFPAGHRVSFQAMIKLDEKRWRVKIMISHLVSEHSASSLVFSVGKK